MKLGAIVLIVACASELANAQETMIREKIPATVHEKKVESPSGNRHSREHASEDHADKKMIELSAIVAPRIFLSDRDPSSLGSHNGHTAPGIIDTWRERVYKSLQAHITMRSVDLANDSKLRSNDDIHEQIQHGRMVQRIVIRETVRFTQERVPEISMLVKALKFEVSTDMIQRQDAQAEIDDSRVKEAPMGHDTAVKNRFFIKTGLRLPVDRGRFSPVSETEARYGGLSSFFVIYLDGQFDNRMGLNYVVGNDMQIKIERHSVHSTDPVTNEKVNNRTSLNLIQLVCRF